jgi:GntR family transcriptional regulator, transcriptional repressor for pyruvate dehydrogenase complex
VIRARTWRGQADAGPTARTIVQHEEILNALTARDPARAEAAALVHVATTEAWFHLTSDEGRHRA